MIQLLIGFILGIFVATVGVNGVLKVFDTGVQKVQEISKEAVK